MGSAGFWNTNRNCLKFGSPWKLFFINSEACNEALKRTSFCSVMGTSKWGVNDTFISLRFRLFVVSHLFPILRYYLNVTPVFSTKPNHIFSHVWSNVLPYVCPNLTKIGIQVHTYFNRETDEVVKRHLMRLPYHELLSQTPKIPHPFPRQGLVSIVSKLGKYLSYSELFSKLEDSQITRIACLDLSELFGSALKRVSKGVVVKEEKKRSTLERIKIVLWG